MASLRFLESLSLPPILRPALTMVVSRCHKISGEFRRKFGRYIDELRSLREGHGSAIAQSAADLLLVHDGLEQLPRSIVTMLGISRSWLGALLNTRRLAGEQP